MDEQLKRIRHSAAHIMAQAVQDLFPGTKLAIGPATEKGFYYDFDCKKSFQPEDLPKIEDRMRQIVSENHPFKCRALPRKEAIESFKKNEENFKVEIIQSIPNEDDITVYDQGPFTDLCRGPHLNATGDLKAFKLLSIAGAYWRGSETNPMLQRIYGTAFPTVKELKVFIKRQEEAQRRDHRKLGKTLDLFSFHQEAPGFPFFHPKGLVLYDALVDFWKKQHEAAGYQSVRTPIILSDELWKRSGHYEHYKEHMYFTTIEDREFAIKPMNCPGGLLIYKQSQHSYRDLPIRMAELGLVHRHELSGVLHGLFRVKSFVIDDAHIYCAPEQIEQEIQDVITLILEIYRTVGFDQVNVELSTRPDQSMGSDEIWEQATGALENALKKKGTPYQVQAGEGAFYGPKIDFHVKDCLDRHWQCGTIQVDFSMPERFELEYVAKDGKKHRPVMIHRACFGSVERFLGILIEHTGGDFPVWLAPVQVAVLSITDTQAPYAHEVCQKLSAQGIRAQCDVRPEKIGYKIRSGEKQKIPFLLVVGEREVKDQKISVRQRGKGDLGQQTLEEFIHTMRNQIDHKLVL